ncbi:Bug family tripartite tricarboxylate transporter substrate binding protein [Hydrogenophaga sp. OTU3427]|uniref:Bug family tripartite tricarboxylate transporter substrate binding protein n=1 Tax=Hydrogenophaga sp. OTU3427 TaxID=3043856 RepID=UPI00313C45E3
MPQRRRTVLRHLALAAALGLPVLSWAQAFPAKPLRIVVPFGAGGVADLTARTVAQKMAEGLGQAVVIDNKPGAGGVGAGEAVAKAAPDGHTLLLMSNGTAVSAGLFKSLPYDTLKDFAPVSTLGYFDIAIVVPESSRFKTLADLLAFAKANPGKLNLGTVNIGSTQNLAAELFKASAGADMQVVPFNGTPAVLNALRGNQVDAAVEILSPMLPQISAKAVRALAVMGEKHPPALPTVPTVRESGIANFNVASWNALAAPAGTPPEVIARLNREVVAALNSADVKKRLLDLNIEARSSTPEQLGSLLSSEVKRWGDVITRANIPRQ